MGRILRVFISRSRLEKDDCHLLLVLTETASPGSRQHGLDNLVAIMQDSDVMWHPPR